MGAQWKAKHKDLAANARGRIFGKLSKDIMLAARSGADPASNARLRLVVEQARKVSMPKETLERAIKKGAGLTGEAVNFEHVIYEGFAPHRVAVMVECLTDNVNRTAPEMRVLFRKGQLGTAGSVAWDFDHLGMIEAEPAMAGADPDMAAIEAGAQDLEPGDEAGTTLFLTDPADLDLVSRALPAQGFKVL
jgi:YebC/PmpR family DNA-binding regulatory protein